LYFQFLFVRPEFKNFGPLGLVLSTYLGLATCYTQEANKEAYNYLFSAFGI